ncbi:MAG: hypothetical protein U9P79_06095 [Candidatus Cloacimonadota bacterium]|nr:hypothetical protein [Candidatus Cloacimonadota bacterium]
MEKTIRFRWWMEDGSEIPIIKRDELVDDAFERIADMVKKRKL